MITYTALRLALIAASCFSSTRTAPMMGRGSRALATAYGRVDQYNQGYEQQHAHDNYDYQEMPATEYDDYHGQQHMPSGLVDRFKNALNVNSYQQLRPERGGSYSERTQPLMASQDSYYNSRQDYYTGDTSGHGHESSQAYQPPYNEGYAGGYDDGYYEPTNHGQVYTYDYPQTSNQNQAGNAYYGGHDQQAANYATEYYPPASASQGQYNQTMASSYYPQDSNNWQLSTYPQEEIDGWQGPEYDPSLYPQEGPDDVYWQPYGQAKYELPDYGAEWRLANPEEHHEAQYYEDRQRERLAAATIPGATYVLNESDNDDDHMFPVNGGIVEVHHKDGSVNKVTILPPKRSGICHDFSQENNYSWWKLMSGKEDRKKAVRKVRELAGYNSWWKRIYAKNKVMVNLVQSDAIQLLDKHGYHSTDEQKRAIARGILKNKYKRPILAVPEYNADKAWFEDTQRWEKPEEDDD